MKELETPIRKIFLKTASFWEASMEEDEDAKYRSICDEQASIEDGKRNTERKILLTLLSIIYFGVSVPTTSLYTLLIFFTDILQGFFKTFTCPRNQNFTSSQTNRTFTTPLKKVLENRVANSLKCNCLDIDFYEWRA